MAEAELSNRQAGQNPFQGNFGGMNPQMSSYNPGMNPGMNPNFNPQGMGGMGQYPMAGLNPNYPVPSAYGNMPGQNAFSMPAYQQGVTQGMTGLYGDVGTQNFENLSQSQAQKVENFANVVSNIFQMAEDEDIHLLGEEKKDANTHTKILKKAIESKALEEEKNERDKKEALRREKNKMKLRLAGKNNTSIDIYVPRSEYFYSRDRLFLEDLIMKNLKVEGPLGRGVVKDIDKAAYFKDDKNFKADNLAYYDNDEEYFEPYIKDGIYLDYIKKLIYSYNIQKLEQRTMRENKMENFKKNGYIRMDNDIFNDIVSKPEDLTPNYYNTFDTYISNSAFNGRNSDEKFKIYKMKVYLYKVMISLYKIFNREEILANEVKMLHRDFYTALNQMNIPYLIEKISIIRRKLEEYYTLKNPNDAEKKEIENMNIFLNESAELLDAEKKLLNEKSHALYSKWQDLKKLRQTQGFQCTRLKLNVLKFENNIYNTNIVDYGFILSNMEIPADDKQSLNAEDKRKKDLNKLKCKVKMYINDIVAFESKEVNITYPFFEAEFNSLYNIDLYTRPVTMHCEVYINGEVAQKFEVDPPGVFAKTITSAATLYEEVPFGPEEEKEEEKKEERNEDLIDDEDAPLLDKSEEEDEKEDEEGMDEEEKKKREKEREERKKKKEKELEKRREKLKKENDKKEKELKKKMDSLSNTKGRIIFRTEYEGKGPDIPPTRIDNKLELISIQKRFQELIRKYNKFDYPFDVNDPRNVAFVEEMKKGRLDLTLKLIYQEYLLTFNEFESLRHYLLKKRNEKSSLKKLKFPILEHDIESDPKLKQIIDLLKAEDARETINAYDRDMDINAKLQKLEEGNPERFFMTNKEFFEFLGLKTKVMKQDIVHYETMKTYREVINEAEIYQDPMLIMEEFCVRLFSKARKLAPLTFRPPPVKLEATNSLKVNIHIVKGYNIPVRFNSFQNDYIEHFQLEAAKLRNPLARDVYVDQNMGVSGAYSGGGGGLSQNNSFNMGMGGPNLSGSFGLNPSINNTMFNPNAMVNPYNTGDYFTSNNIKLSDKIQYLAQFEKKINSFIEIRVVYYDQEKTFRTDSVEGIHPDYNQHLEFEIKPSNGKEYFTREELAKCPGVFYFTLYDQVRHDGVAGFDDEIRLQVFQNRFLGSFTIPFVTIFQNASLLDTLCKVDVPKTIFGYYSDTSDTFDVRKRFGEDINRDKKDKEKEVEIKMEQKGEVDRLMPIKKIVDPFSNTYVSLYITLDPVPNFSKNEDDDYVAGYEDSVFLINGTKWLKELKTQLKFKDRNIRLFAENFDGFSVFMPRYLKPEGEKPPDEIFDISASGSTDPKAIEVAARYVALIPFIEDSQTWSDGSAEDLPDAWCTDKEFLQLGFGDYEEHAVLLCNYFNYIDQKQNTPCVSYLTLCHSHPEGSSVYVCRISEQSKEVEFWNAKTGDCFYFDKTVEKNNFLCMTVSENFRYTKAQGDRICQLKSVGSIVTFDNVYVNLQNQEDPGLIHMDLDNPSHWMPFLTPDAKNKYFPEGVKSVQTDDIIYNPPLADESVLRNRITEELRNAIEKERLAIGRTTKWDEVSNDSIRKILERYDSFSMQCTKSMISVNRDIVENVEQSAEEREKLYEEKIKNIEEEKEKLIKDLEDLENKIKGEFVGQKDNIYGFPLNMSFTSMEQIIDTVKLTNIHFAANSEDTLSLTVYVSPLPMNVNSIWIFLAIIKG